MVLDDAYYEKNEIKNNVAMEIEKMRDTENKKKQEITAALLYAFKEFKNIEITSESSGTTLEISKACKSKFWDKKDCCDTVTNFLKEFTNTIEGVYDVYGISVLTPLSKFGISVQEIKRNFFESCKKSLDDKVVGSFLHLIGVGRAYFPNLDDAIASDSNHNDDIGYRDSIYDRDLEGGSHSRRKRRTSKKSRKNRRRHRRSSHNKKRHTKRYRKRK